MAVPVLVAGGLMLLATVLGIVLSLDLKRFLGRTSELASPADLAAYRQVVARQMYGALTAIVLSGIAGLIVSLALFRNWITWGELPPLLIPAVVMFAVGAWSMSIEARAKEIGTAERALQEARDRVVETWMTKPLPDRAEGPVFRALPIPTGSPERQGEDLPVPAAKPEPSNPATGKQ